MPREFFDSLADALVGFLRPEYRRFSSQTSGRNIKIWFGDEHREHYEVQFLRGRSLEVGFHAEHASAQRNDEVVKQLSATSRALGGDVQSGTFVGMRSSPWRRVSEVWKGAGLDAPETAIEAAERLAVYIHTLEPARSR